MGCGADPGARVDRRKEHDASAGRKYGDTHVTRTGGPCTRRIVERIASVCPDAETTAEVGAGACMFASLLRRKLQLASMRGVADWTEIRLTQWRLVVETSVRERVAGVRNQDTRSVFSVLDTGEIEHTVAELEAPFAGRKSFDVLHRRDVAMFEKT